MLYIIAKASAGLLAKSINVTILVDDRMRVAGNYMNYMVTPITQTDFYLLRKQGRHNRHPIYPKVYLRHIHSFIYRKATDKQSEGDSF